MNGRKRVLSYILTAVLSAAVTAVLVFCVMATEKQQEQTKLEALESLITERFIGESDQTAMLDAAADAMVQSLGDRWSYYIPAKDYAAYEEQKENAYVGIGVTILNQESGDGLEIQTVTPGGSAEEAGLLPGDVIVAVDGTSIAGMELDAIKDKIRGEEGTQVSLTVRRDGAEQTFSVTRRQIVTPVATATMLEDHIGLVRIANFNRHCAEETIAAIEALREQGAEKLIFDVRFNPGGYAKEMVTLLDYLLPEGPLFRMEDYTGKQSVDSSDAEFLDMPMAVLVNGSSYSAAEFFAAALSEYEAATVVGEQTCGKGYFQNTFTLPDGSAVGLSVGKYYTPKGVSLADVGITPDVVVPVDTETAGKIYNGTLDPGEDPQILSAMEALKS